MHPLVIVQASKGRPLHRAVAGGRSGEAPDRRVLALATLAEPAEAEFRATLRALLTTILAEPGQLVNPVYVGPLLHHHLLKHEIESLAEALEIRLVARHEVGVRAGETAGVALLTEQEAARLAQYGVRPADHVQVIVWGRKAAKDLAPHLREWISTGIDLNPGQESLGGDRRSMQEAITTLVCTHTSGCLVWVGPPPSLPGLAAEARVRLELAGCAPVADVPASDGTGAAAVVATLADAMAADGWPRLQALQAQGARVVVVTDPAGEAMLRRLGADGARVVEAAWGWEMDAVPGSRGRQWPALEQALIGSIPSPLPRANLVSFPLRSVSMGDVLTAPALKEKPGILVVYEQRRLGWVRLNNGEIRDVRRVQETRAVGTATEIVSRVRDLARWTDAHAVFIPGHPAASVSELGGGCRLPQDAVAFDLLSMGNSSTGFASREQEPDQVAGSLAAFGLVEEASVVLQNAARDKELGATGASLLACLHAAEQPLAAAESFRQAVRLSQGTTDTAEMDIAIDAGLNALLVEVRASARSAASAWTLIGQAGLADRELLAHSAPRLGVVLEIALRAARYDAALEVAGWLRAAEPGTLPVHLAALVSGVAAPAPAPAPDADQALAPQVADGG